MCDTKVQGLAKADAVIPGIYSVYIDQDDQPDGFTVRESDLVTNHLGPENRTNFDRTGCREAHPNNNRSFNPYLKVAQGNSFELASGTPLDKSVFQNAAGEKIEADAKVILLPEKAPEYAVGGSLKLTPAITFTAGALISGTYPFANKSPWRGSWTVTGFKIAGFTDDPERKNIENMSNVPDEKRKYAVIDVELVSTDRVASYKKDYMKCAPDGTCETTHVYETRTALLNDLRSEIPSSIFGSKDLSRLKCFCSALRF